MISIETKGSFSHLEKFLANFGFGKNASILAVLEEYGAKGVEALAQATPIDSGETSNSWSYEVVQTSNGYRIEWSNSNVNQGVPIALILQYGHGTGTGSYVAGIDYINPAIESIFQGLQSELEGVLTRL